MSIPIRRIANPLFGKPSLAAAGNGTASWIRGNTSPLDQKSSTGWLACLYGGVQTGDDWARVNSPTDEVFTTDFNYAQWSWYQTATQSMGLGIVIWVHDPNNLDNRAEISQLANVSGLAKAAGWNSHTLDSTVSQFFFYGEGTTGTGLTAGTLYTWDEFQADVIFSRWTIYRITLDWGWEASGTFQAVYVADIKLNGVNIPLLPEVVSHKKTVLTTKTVIGGACTAGDVISEHATTGTDWDFDFGGTGYITKAVAVLAAANKTERLRLWLFDAPPTSAVNDNVASTAPLAADVPYLVGYIDFPAMSSEPTTAFSATVAVPSTVGNLPLAFNKSVLYGILIGRDAVTLTNVLLSIHLFAEMED